MCERSGRAARRGGLSLTLNEEVNESMIPELAKLRSDLVINGQQSGEETIYVLKDPASGRFFRFKEIEGFILQQLDGKTSLQTLRERTEQKFEAELPPEILEQFIARMRSQGLLEIPGTLPAGNRRPRRIQGDPFYLRIKIFDPNLLFERLSRNLRFLFTPVFLVVSGASILLAAGITLNAWMEIEKSVYSLFQSFSLLAAWLIVLVVVTAHEFAHGVTCRRFGGEVHEVGFLLLYFMPAFYCNVSDTWLFSEKSKRLWVTFAGAYVEIFLWALATLAWQLTEPFTAVNEIALVVMATSGIKTLFNLNPLIKLDGYYLLSDYLEIPNLRARAFTYLKDKLRAPFGFPVRPLRETTARERKIYLAYGLSAAAYSFWLVATFVFYFGEFLTSKYQGWGFVFFLIFLFGMFRRRLGTLFYQPLAWLRAAGGNFFKLSKPKRIAVYLAAAAAVLFLIRMPLTVTGEFAILPLHNADVRAEVEEIITHVFVEEGDTVQPGEPVVQLSDRALNAELQKTISEKEKLEARLKLLKIGPRPEEVKLAQTRVAKAEGQLRFAGKNLERTQALFDRRLLSQREFEQVQESVSVLGKELEEEKSILKVLLAGSRKEEIEALEAEVEGLLAQENYLRTQLERLTVRSPSAGVVATPKLKEKIGQHVAKGDLIAKVYDLKNVTVEIPISEKDIADVKIEQPVAVKARAYPGRSFPGKVNSIAPVATLDSVTRQKRIIVVRAVLDNSSLLLKPGMSGNAKIYGEKHSLLNLLVRRFLRFIRVEVWSWW